MFCPNCGRADQKPETYCRQCGNFLVDANGKRRPAFGGKTPEEQINVNLFLSFLTAVVSLILMIALYASFAGRRETFPVVYVVAAFLCAISGWQFSNFYVGLKLKKIFNQRRKAEENIDAEVETTNSPDLIQSVDTQKILAPADFENLAAPSVTEHTTRTLNKIPRR